MKRNADELSFATTKKNIIKFKIVFIGDQAVGKSSIINRFIKNEFDESHNATIGIDFVSKNIILGQKTIRLQLWDTAGQERFRSLIPNYLRDSQVAFIVYDLTNYESFEAVTRWVDFIKEFRGDDVLVYAIGNKLDLQDIRAVDTKTAFDKFEELGIKSFEVSAKSGENLDNAFKSACQMLLNLPVGSTGPIKMLQGPKHVQEVSTTLQQQAKIAHTGKSRLQHPKNTESRRIKDKNCC